MFKDEAGILTGPMAAALEAEFGVTARISPHDHLLNALAWVHKGDVAQAFRTYIEDGQRNALKVKEIFASYPPPTPEDGRPRILDFASGYGRVGRHIPKIAPGWAYTGMDIHREAVAFNRNALGLDTLLSHHDPDQLRGLPQFDGIFALSFFSHVRKYQFGPWLEALHRLLAPGGILMFTTHGQDSHTLTMPQAIVDADGYGMLKESEQYDLSTDYYVHAITYEPFVRAALAKVPGLEIIAVEPKAWWGHQDMYVVRCAAPAAPMPTARALKSDLIRLWRAGRAAVRRAGKRLLGRLRPAARPT